MPVVFAQPSPVGADIAARAGRQSGLFQQAQITARREASAFDHLAQAQRNQIAAADQQVRAAGQDADILQRAYEFEQSLAQRERMQAVAVQAEQIQQRERFQLAAWANGQDITATEQARLSQMQNSLGALQAMHANGQYTDEEYFDAVAQIRTGISPIQQKLQATQQRRQESMLREDQENATRMSAATAAAAKFEKSTMRDRLVPLPPEMGGGFLHNSKPGQWDYVKPEKPAKPDYDLNALRTQAEGFLSKAFGETWKDKPLEEQRRLIQEEIELRENEIKAQQQRGQPTGAYTPQPPPGQGRPPADGTQARPPAPRPFKLDSPEKVDAARQTIRQDYFDMRKAAEKLPDNPDKQRVQAAVQVVGAIVAKYGRAPLPGEPDHSIYEELKTTVIAPALAGASPPRALR